LTGALFRISFCLLFSRIAEESPSMEALMTPPMQAAATIAQAMVRA
jgi:hypothetical protein